MGYYRDFREYLEALERAGRLKRVLREINKDTELHPLVRWQFRGLEEDQRFGFFFERVIGYHGESYRGMVASSVLAPCLEAYALALKCEPHRQAIYDRWAQAYHHPIPPRLVATGPVKEEVHIGGKLLEHGGLKEFPIPMTTNGWESLPRLTGLRWVTKDPETGEVNVGTYNGTLLGPARTCVRVAPRGHLRVHWQKAKARGMPLPAAAVVGPPPVVAITSITEMPYGVSELDVAGGLAGEPMKVVKCETVDLEVPATAEVVLEGEIPTDYLEPDAASGEHTGYTFIERLVFAFHIKAITHRKDPIWHDMVDQFPPASPASWAISPGRPGC